MTDDQSRRGPNKTWTNPTNAARWFQMAFIQIVDPDKATGLIKLIYDAAIKRVGYVAHIIKIMGQHPESCQASMGLYASLMKSDNGLSGEQREMLATVVSNVNDCYY